ncbi:hypothetical protein PS9374_03157 [Planomonospora sphaerica]|uniref:Uncharacterized protein n=1 Tax=Planomonospora sphaerica TaxID=161355 RepID=A0A171D0E5_9ACTN|nr:hypothetical protein PS9374_03157 [Planomonospora sphaerica]
MAKRRDERSSGYSEDVVGAGRVRVTADPGVHHGRGWTAIALAGGR